MSIGLLILSIATVYAFFEAIKPMEGMRRPKGIQGMEGLPQRNRPRKEKVKKPVVEEEEETEEEAEKKAPKELDITISKKTESHTKELTELPINPEAPTAPEAKAKLFNEIYPKLKQRIGSLKMDKKSVVECFEIQNFCSPQPLNCKPDAKFHLEDVCFGGCKNCYSCIDTRSLKYEKYDELRQKEDKPLLGGGRESNMMVTGESYKMLYDQVVNTYKCKACIKAYNCHRAECPKVTPPTCIPEQLPTSME